MSENVLEKSAVFAVGCCSMGAVSAAAGVAGLLAPGAALLGVFGAITLKAVLKEEPAREKAFAAILMKMRRSFVLASEASEADVREAERIFEAAISQDRLFSVESLRDALSKDSDVVAALTTLTLTGIAARDNRFETAGLVKDFAELVLADAYRLAIEACPDFRQQAILAVGQATLSAVRVSDKKIDRIAARLEGFEELNRSAIQRAAAADSRSPIPSRIGVGLQRDAGATASVDDRRLAVGETVRWGRLQDGVYAPRTTVLQQALSACTRWLAELEERGARRRLPVFWVAGRSGDGKSVLLLQLAEALLTTRPDAEIYQSSLPDNLPTLIEELEAKRTDTGLAIILVDDLHQVSDLRAFNAALKSLLDGVTRNVVAIACGPTPEMQDFAARAPLLHVVNWVMPGLSSVDVDTFAQWFSAPLSTSQVSDRTILVELLFEQKVGEPLATFATAFGNRLKNLGAAGAATRLVTINSFDLGAPDAIFKENSERDVVERLAREDQLHFEWKEEKWGAGVRLVHGAIAWKLFDAWTLDHLLGVDIEERLRRSLESVLRLGQLPPRFTSQLIGRVRSRLPSVLGLERDEAGPRTRLFLDRLLARLSGFGPAQSSILCALFSESWENSSAPDLSHLALAKQLLGDRELTPYEKASLASYLGVLESEGLVEAGRFREQAESIALQHTPAIEMADIVTFLVSRGGSSPTLIDLWFAGKFLPPKDLLCTALYALGPTPNVRAAAMRWIGENWNRVNGIEPLIALVRRGFDDDVRELALRWLEGHGGSRHASELISVMVGADPANDDVRKLALDWVNRTEDHREAAPILVGLLNAPGRKEREEVRARVATSIKALWETATAADMICVALRQYWGAQEYVDVARKWLTSHWDHRSSANVLATLMRATRDPKDIALALRWNEDHPDEEHATHLLSGIANASRNDDEALNRIVGILEKRLSSPAAFNPLATLLRLRPTDQRVREISMEWVRREADTNGVGQLIASLVRAWGRSAALDDLALGWLDRNRRNKTAGQLISALLKACPDDAEFRARGLAWLQENGGSSEAADLLSALTSCKSEDVERFASEWIAENAHRPDKQHAVIAALIYNSLDQANWIEFGFSLLLSSSLQPPVPPHVVEALATVAPRDKRTALIVLSYTAANENRIPNRQRVLETWLEIGRSEALSYVVDRLRSRERESKSGTRLFAIYGRAIGHAWRVALESVKFPGEDASDVCYAVGFGIPSRSLPDAELVALAGTLREWPKEDVCYILKGLLLSACPWVDLEAFAVQWLNENWRKRGYGVVLEGLKSRWQQERIRERLPLQVRKDLSNN